jgi:predicted transcriptional regulator YheO
LLNAKCEKKDTNRIVGVLNTSEANTLIRNSNLMVRDDDGKLQYVICVNQDITGFAEIQPFFKHMFSDKEKESVDFSDSADIEEIMTNIILEEVKHSDIYRFETKAAKMAVLVRLSNRGVFKVKQAIPKVCEVLNIAQPTLYKYLKLIEKDEEE